MKKLFIIASVCLATAASAQTGKVGINTTNPKASLDVNMATVNANTTTPEGILIPRVSRARLSAMGTGNAIETSTMVYVNDVSNGTASGVTLDVDIVGFYFYDGAAWKKMVITDTSLYKNNGSIPANTNRTVTLADDTSKIQFSRSGTSSTTELVDVLGTIKATALDLKSDQRLKTNIKPIDKETSGLKSVNPVSYNWNAEGKTRGGNNDLQYGFIAQDLEKTYPNLVTTDAEGYKAVNYIEMIPILTKAVQNMMKENEILKAKVAELEKLLKR